MSSKLASEQQQRDANVELHPVQASCISLSEDGGVNKTIVKEGSGTELPLPGDRVSVHYVGTLEDGTKFDSSRDRGKTFDFKLGRGTVIKAWELGVATMKTGEVAVITCTPDYAYGDTGSGPVIGPHANLVFEIELIKFKGEDLSIHKDDGVTRRLLRKGEGHSTPNDGAVVCVHIRGESSGMVFDERDVEFRLGQGDQHAICPGLEHALKKFKLKELSKLHISSKYAFGKSGNAELRVPPDSDVVYEVEMKSFEKAKEIWEMDTEERIAQARNSKETGTECFKVGDYSKACVCYKSVLSMLEGEVDGELKSERHSLLLAAHLNLALCYLKLGEDHQAEKHCDLALTFDPTSQKGLYRRAQARSNKKKFESAIADFRELLKLDPDNKSARKELHASVCKLKQFRLEEKNVYAGMFNKFAAASPTPQGHIYQKKGDDVFQAIDEWNNDMAKDMMSLEQELEAFGETMPLKHEKVSSSKRSETNKLVS